MLLALERPVPGEFRECTETREKSSRRLRGARRPFKNGGYGGKED
jgi:hypothetical protein